MEEKNGRFTRRGWDRSSMYVCVPDEIVKPTWQRRRLHHVIRTRMFVQSLLRIIKIIYTDQAC
jgi:hypothetical protein